MSPHRYRLRPRPGLLGAGLILLALWVQALAPVAALRMALAAPDPLAGAALCGHGDAPAGTAPAGRPPGAPGTCDLCGLCRAGMAPPPTLAASMPGRSLRWSAAAPPLPPPDRPGSAPRPGNRPRDPPTPA